MTENRSAPHFKVPEGFTHHDGGECPVPEDMQVEALVRTAEGIGSSGITLARVFEWRSSEHEDGIGAVLAYRISFRGDVPHFHVQHRWHPSEPPERTLHA